MEATKVLIGNELTSEQVEFVSGGIPVLGAVGIATAYLFILDQAWHFGEGLGSGFYDATHGKP